MSAADKREELEALLWRLLPGVGDVDAALGLADAYASAVADAEGQARFDALQERRRDAYRATQGAGLRPCGTVAAARRHRRHGEPVDEACLRAESADRLEDLRAQMTRARVAGAS